jgi:hypothetical protein
MSDVLRIAVVAEGITDYLVLTAAIESMLQGRAFDLKLLQPEESVAFTEGGNAGALGGGWRGVYKWCLQVAERNGRLQGDILFLQYDMLLIHLDADVASEDPANYPNHPIPNLAGVLPCDQACPPASNTTNALRSVLLSWLNEQQTPTQTILCTPSKSTESWVMAAFFPSDAQMRRLGLECHPKPADRLAQQKKKFRFSKSASDYEARIPHLTNSWPAIVKTRNEASRFHNDFIAAIPP